MEITKQKTKLLPYSGDKTFILDISKELETKIRTFCALSPTREWSGVLFYTFTGDYQNGIIIEANDMYLMDQGSAAHTEFDLNEPEITRYMVMEGLMHQCIGLIHSHNQMNAFFSGEDTDTLIEHGTAMNNFVSLVVNNDGNYVARLTRQLNLEGKSVKTVKGTLKSPVFNTDTILTIPVEKTENAEIKDQWIEYIDLKINKPSYMASDYLERFGEVASKRSVQKAPAFNAKTSDAQFPIPVQGKLFEDVDDDPTVLLDKDAVLAVNSVNWRAMNYTVWFNQLMNGSPFESYQNSLEDINRKYKKRFPNEVDFAVWFEMWLDFMVSDFEWPKNFDLGTPLYSEEEILLYKVYGDIQARGYAYKDVMLETIATRLM